MCLIQRLPAKIIDFPIAYTDGQYFGGTPTSEPPKVRKTSRSKPKQVAEKKPTKPVLAGLLPADMGLPARDMGAERLPCRITAKQEEIRERRNMTRATISQGEGHDSDYHPCCRYTENKVRKYIFHRSHGVHGSKPSLQKHCRVSIRKIAATQISL